MFNGSKHVSKYGKDFKYAIGLVHDVYSDIKLTCFPSVMFDPVWILVDKKQISKHSKLNNFDNFFGLYHQLHQ